MQYIRLKNTSEDHFYEAWDLYENAFPIEERRPFEAQVKIFKNTNYHFDIICKEDKFIGLLFWWDFPTMRFIEYFATHDRVRNKGYGKLILENFIDRSDKPIILEVELPATSLEQRRIKFYQRVGFHLNEHHYEIPPMQEGFSALELLIMSYPDPISDIDVRHFSEQYHPILFKA